MVCESTYVFYVFFKIQKTWLLTFFWLADHVFSNTDADHDYSSLWQYHTSYAVVRSAITSATEFRVIVIVEIPEWTVNLYCSMDGYTGAVGDSRSVVKVSTADDGRTKMDKKAACVDHQHPEQRASDTTATASSCCSCWRCYWRQGWCDLCWTGDGVELSCRSVVYVRHAADHCDQVEPAGCYQNYVRPFAINSQQKQPTLVKHCESLIACTHSR